MLPSIADENLATFRYGMKCFFEEGRALAKLSHPNVVRVLNFFRANETVYLVMRYERGRTLQEHIQARRGAMKENFIRRVFTLLLNGLREVHANKLLHLDIKPANVYIRNDITPVLHRLRRRAPDAHRGGVQAEPDVHAGLRVAGALPEARAARAVERHLLDRREHLRLPRRRRAAGRRPAGREGQVRLGDEALRDEVLGPAARDDRLVPAARPLEAPAERDGAAESALARARPGGAEQARRS